jgi:hypothetical protein
MMTCEKEQWIRFGACSRRHLLPTNISYHSFGKALRNANLNASKASSEKQPCQNEKVLQATGLRIVGWAIQAELAKRQKRAEKGCTLSAQMAKMLTKMRVFCSDFEKCIEYVSECYNFSEQVLNKGGLTLVAKEMFR